MIQFTLAPTKTMKVRSCTFESLDPVIIRGLLTITEKFSEKSRDEEIRRYAVLEDPTRSMRSERVFKVSKPLEPGDHPIHYDVLMSWTRGVQCDCRGFSARNGLCCHTEALAVLCGLIPARPGNAVRIDSGSPGEPPRIDSDRLSGEGANEVARPPQKPLKRR